MKSVLAKLVLTILGGAFLCIGLASCKNFLNAGKTKAEIEEAIEIANSKAVTIYITADEGSGSVIPESITSKKKEVFDLKFTPKQNYKFLNWEVIDRTSGQVVPDAVKFEDPFKAETKACLLKPDTRYQIHAKCVLLPAIVSVSPDVSERAYSNTPIYITFNMPMEEESVTPSESVFKYDSKNISIYCGADDMSDKFDQPSFFDSTKTKLVLTPKASELINYIGNIPYIDIEISFGENIKVIQDNVAYTILENQNKTITVRYTSAKENNPPEEQKFLVTRHKISLQSNFSDYSENDFFNYENYSDTSGDDAVNQKMLQNRTNGTIYIYGKYYDAESGVRAVTVKEKLINSPQAGKGVISDEYPFIYLFGSEGAEFLREDGGYTYFCIEHKLVSKDGAVRVQVEVSDVAGNTAAPVKQFVAVKKSELNLSVQVTNGGAAYAYNFYGGEPFDEIVYNEAIKNICISDSSNAHTDFSRLYPVLQVTPEVLRNYSFICEYVDEGGKTWKEKFDYSSSNWHYTLKVNKVSGLEFKIIASDDIGNTAERVYKIPDNNQITYFKEEVSYNNQFEYAGIVTKEKNCDICEGGIYIENRTDNTRGGMQLMVESVSSNSTYGFAFRKDTTSYFQIAPCVSTENNGHFSLEIPTDLVIRPGLSSATVGQVQLKDNFVTLNTTTELCDDDYALKVTVWIADNSWDSFDLIFLQYGLRGRTTFEYGKNSCTVLMKTRNLFTGVEPLKIYGFKDGKAGPVVEKTIGPLTDPQYDNIPPLEIPSGELRYDTNNDLIHNYQRKDWDYYTLRVWDNESGPGESKFKVRGLDKEFIADNSNNYTVKIPIRNIEPYVRLDGTGNVHEEYYLYFDYWLYDAAGNCRRPEKTDHGKIEIGNYPSVGKITFNSNNWAIESEVYEKEIGSFYTDFIVEKLIKNNNTYEWQSLTESLTNTKPTESSKDGGYVYTSTIKARTNSTFPQVSGSYIRIIAYDYDGYSQPSYFYVGSASVASCDYIVPHTEKSVLVNSNQPAFVHTLVTSASYDECKNWTAKEWEYYHDHIGDTMLDFVTYPMQQKYDIPIREITKGNCYAVVVHFASGETAVSQVFVKED